MRKKPSVIVPKEALSRPPTEKEEMVEVTKKEKKDVVIPTYVFVTDNITIRQEHPELADLYATLRELIIMEAKGFRSSELRRAHEHNIQRQRILIQNFEKENNVSRQDHLRWAGIY